MQERDPAAHLYQNFAVNVFTEIMYMQGCYRSKTKIKNG